MRILYLILKVTLNYALRIFYPRIKLINSPKQLFGRTIYVSNHPASFMDPLAIAALRMPIVFFMTRSDVFTPLSKPFLWACHMLPIYRAHDGQDTREKNDAVFKKCTRILSFGRNLLIFGEGFTDEKFIRRLKPMKKGAVKIGFGALEATGWKKKIYISAIGCNYSHPNKMRSDLLISTSDRICLNDYREEYEESPNKVINDITRMIGEMIKDQITHVEDKQLAPFHENMMIISRKGMNPDSYDKSRTLVQRWKYSQKLAKWLNKQNLEENEKLNKLKTELEGYFQLLKRMRLDDPLVFWKKENGTRTKELIALISLFPFAIVGLIHCFVPYIIIKRFTEKTFRKRHDFWGSVKLIGGMIFMGLINIPYIFLFYYLVYPSWWLAFAYYASIGLTGLAAYLWFANLKSYKAKGMVNKANIEKFIKKRDSIEAQLNEVLPELD